MATAEKLLDWARSQLGVKENPAGSNRVKYNTDYYGRSVSGAAYPWCMAFVWDGFRLCGASALLYGVKTAYCPTMVTAFRQQGAWVSGNYRPGDIVFYDWNGDGVADHVGIVESATAGGVVAIEGNTAIGNDSNGGEVMRRTRANSVILGAGRPAYEEDFEVDEKTMREIARDEILKVLAEQRHKSVDEFAGRIGKELQALAAAGTLKGKGGSEAYKGIDMTEDMARVLTLAKDYTDKVFDSE